MRTNVVIDQDLLEEARESLGARTKRETIELALKQAVRINRQKGLLALRGIGWEGDLDAMRTD